MTDRISIPALCDAASQRDDEFGPTLLALVEAVEAAYRYPCTNCKAKFAPHHPGCPGARFDFGESDA